MPLPFSKLDLKAFGHEITISGVIYSDPRGEVNYLIQFPDEDPLGEVVEIQADGEDWKKLLAQTDQMEVEILAKAKDGTLTKAIVRKCNRQIEQGISWNVFRRDNYSCRYCGSNTVPLTVDHLVLYEKGGPAIEDNLVAACRKCNKTRGNTEYADWLASPEYVRVSRSLSPIIRQANAELVPRLSKIPLKYHVVSR